MRIMAVLFPKLMLSPVAKMDVGESPESRGIATVSQRNRDGKDRVIAVIGCPQQAKVGLAGDPG